MENIYTFIFFIYFLATLVVLIATIINKWKLHFLLLKEIYPNKMNEIKSLFQYILWQQYTIDNDTSFWIFIPFYYANFPLEMMSETALSIHNKLKRNNKKMAFGCICVFISFLIIIIT